MLCSVLVLPAQLSPVSYDLICQYILLCPVLSWSSSPPLHYCRFCIQKRFNRVPCSKVLSWYALLCPVLSSTGRHDVVAPVTLDASSVMMLLFNYMFLVWLNMLCYAHLCHHMLRDVMVWSALWHYVIAWYAMSDYVLVCSVPWCCWRLGSV